MSYAVSGVDLSLTGTGLARWEHGEPLRTGRFDPGEVQDLARILVIVDAVSAWVTGSDLVVLEGPAYGASSGKAHERGGLWWMTKHLLVEAGYRVAVVPPSSLKLYVTGSGRANKDQVLLAVERRYPGIVSGNDEADALVLAAMGARWLGAPIERTLPAKHLGGMKGVAWPTTPKP